MNPIRRDELDQNLRVRFLELEAALGRSHCPYSGLCVGAGLVLESGEMVIGVNFESASYGLTLCAERAAIARAQAQGSILEVRAVLLAARRLRGDDMEPPLTPCGACRQWLVELSDRIGTDLPVYSFWRGGQAGLLGSVQDLLPEAFT